VPRDRDQDLDPGQPRPVDPADPSVLYVQLSVQRPPRTLWERLRGWLGARFFEVQTRAWRDPD